MPGLDHDTALEEEPTGTDALAEVHKRAMRRFDEQAWPQQELRAQSLEARRFVTIPGAQWEGEWGEQFENSIKVEIDKVHRGVEKIENDYRENRIVPDFRPDGDKADEDTANMLDGLHRADSYRFKAQQARDNAFFEASRGGFGAYRLTNEWEDECDRDNDYQRVNPGAIITDADQRVFFGPSELYDKSDAPYCFVRSWLVPESFTDEYGDDKATSFPEAVAWKYQEWFRPETITVAEYYEVEEVSEALYVLTYTLSGEQVRVWSSELEPGELEQRKTDGWQVKRQNRKRRRVHKYVMSGAEVLEDLGHIAGECIPVVPVYGKRYFVDGMERWEGYVEKRKDRQRLYNSNVSKLAETNSLAPRETPIFDPEQITPGMATDWARANIDRLPYLLAHALRDEQGNPVHMGPIGYVKPPDIPQVAAALLQIANQDLLEDMVDGADTVKANTSAEAMDIAATRIDAKSGIYLDNMRQSAQREGEIYLSMAREVYREPGRKVETMSEDGQDGQAVLHQAVTAKDGQHRIVNDLQGAKYKVIASVTEATATRRDKTVKSMLATAEVAIQAQDMELSQAAILTAVLNQDGEGIDDFQKWARKKALGLGLVEPNEEEQAAMDQAAENQQPDPMAGVAEAEALRLRTEAADNMAQIAEREANTGLKKAQTVKTLSEAGEKHAGMVERLVNASLAGGPSALN